MRIAGLLLTYAFGLALTTAGLRLVALRNPDPSNGMLEHLAARGDSYDVIVIGPSFVRMHFVPSAFERELRARGHSLRAFGFGLKGMRGGELDYYLDRILELDLPNLKWVLCDVSLEQLRPLEEGNLYKRRLIQWHGPQQFLFMQDAIMAGEGALYDRLVYVSRHARHALLNLGNVGEGVEALSTDSWLPGERRVRDRGAFGPRKWSERKIAKAVKRYKKRLKRKHEKAVRRLAEKREHAPKRPRDNGMMRHWRDRIRASGVQPAFILSPLLSDIRFTTEVPGDEPLLVFDFDDPRVYPELYEPTLRYNTTHFHYEGALRFSSALAGVMAAHLDRQGGARPGAADGTAAATDTGAEAELEAETDEAIEAELEAVPEGEAEPD